MKKQLLFGIVILILGLSYLQGISAKNIENEFYHKVSNLKTVKNTIMDDNTPPSVEIIQPFDGVYIYFYLIGIDEFIPLPLPITIIIDCAMGTVPTFVEVEAWDESGIDRVEFYRDGIPDYYTDYDSPYTLEDQYMGFKGEIKAVAYDNAGNSESDSIYVLRFG